MCVYADSVQCRTDERHSRIDRKMDRSSGRTQVVSVSPRSAFSSKDPNKFGAKEHSSRRFHGPDHLNLNVQ